MAAIHDPQTVVSENPLRGWVGGEADVSGPRDGFGRIQLIRKRRSVGGAEQFLRLEINRREVIEQVLLLGTAAQLDKLFDGAY